MIAVVMFNPENGQIAFNFEGGDMMMVKQILAQIVSNLDEQLKKPKLVIPQTAPPNIRDLLGGKG